MKRFTILLTLFVFTFSSCATTGNGSKNADGKKLDSKFLAISDGFSGQLTEKNFSAAFMRMSETYRTIYSEKEFTSECEKFFDGTNTISASKSKFCADQGDFYIYCETEFSNQKTITLAFNPDSGFPIMILFKKYEKSETKTLKELCENNFKIGCGMTGYNPSNSAMKVEKYTNLAAKQFSSATSTNLMKPSSILIQRKSMENAANGNYEPYLDFSNVDPILTWAQKNNVKVRGHTLVWHTQTPDWFFKEGYKTEGDLVDRETMIKRTDSFIKQYLTYCQEKYPGVVYCWDVVNEAVDASGGDTSSFFRCRKMNGENKNLWYYTIGNDYPEISFRIARKYADPDVRLFYNDYSTTDTTKRNYIYKLCKDLAEKGLIDGIGMQSYWDINNPSLATIRKTLENFGELGLEIQLTEWSMPVKQEIETEFNAQADRYASIFRLLKKLDTSTGGNLNITCVSSFGLMDHYPYYKNDTNNTRWWDANYQPKPSFYAIRDALAFE